MKFNMGCGFKKLEGYVNVDKYPECSPDMQFDLEVLPWPIAADQATEILFNHSLEHMGQSSEAFLGIIKEIYRISKEGAAVKITVPHPRHDLFLGDPTHVRPITPITLSLFSKEKNRLWQARGESYSPLAIYLDVDFEIESTLHILEQEYFTKMQEGELSEEDVLKIASEKNNIVTEYQFLLRVKKEPSASALQ